MKVEDAMGLLSWLSERGAEQMVEPSSRLKQGILHQPFADFLDRLAAGNVDDDEWSRFIVTHYSDEFLEEVRRCTARLMQNRLVQSDGTHEEVQTLHSWAITLRSHPDGASVK